MKGLIYTAAFAATIAFAVIAFQASAQAPQHDWKREMALMGNDVASMLHYQPTDQSSYAGKIRQAMHPGEVK